METIKNKENIPAHPKGYVLFALLLVVSAIVISGIGLINSTTTSRRMAIEARKHSQTRYLAESGVALVLNRAAHGANEGIVDDYHGDITVSNHTVDVDLEMERDGAGDVKVHETRGRYDLLSYVSFGSVVSEAEAPNGTKVKIRQKIRFEEYPIFQFDHFFEGNIWHELGGGGIHIKFLGRVHSNSSSFFIAADTMSFHDWLTSPCEIWEKPRVKNGNVYPGQIMFTKISDGLLGAPRRSPTTSFTLIDTPDCPGNGVDDGEAKKVAYGENVPVFSIPFGMKHPILLIQPKNHNEYGEYVSGFDTEIMKKHKFAYKADLLLRKERSGGTLTHRWIEHNAYGTEVTASYNTQLLDAEIDMDDSLDTAPHPDSTRLFFDYSQREWMNVTYIDVGVLLDRLDSYYADAGLIYLEGEWDTTNNIRDVFILRNGDTLTRPLTYATNCPLYIWGDYNTAIPVQPAAIANDYTIILSNNWDANYRDSHLGSSSRNRYAEHTTINTCIMTGLARSYGSPSHNDPDNQYYYLWYPCAENNHESENQHFTFEENWQHVSGGDRIIKWRGSTVAMWRSQYFHRNYFQTSNDRWSVYLRPIRDYGFDTLYTSMDKMPPGTPHVVAPVNIDYYEIR